jgi:Pyridoxamine 5'-phosphate oxidase
MNRHLQERVEQALAQYDTAILVTCGPAGPQASPVGIHVRGLNVQLYVPRNAEHHFNLSVQPELILLTARWKLSGRMTATDEHTAPHDWESVVHVQPLRIHILNEDGTTTLETIDIETTHS